MAGFEQATSAGFRPGTITTGTGYDTLELLPPLAAERLRQLRQRTHDSHAIIPQFDDRQAANTARGDAERRLQRLLAPRSEGGFKLAPHDPQVIEVQQRLDKLTDEARRLNELYEVRYGVWVAASHALQALEQWLRDGRPDGPTLHDYDGPEPRLNKGESLLDAVSRLQRRARELKADAHRIQSACYPSAYCKQRMRAQIEQLAQQGAPDVSSLVEHDREIGFMTRHVQSEVRGGEQLALGFAQVPDAVALLAFVHKDAMIAALDREIDAEADDKSALSHEARQQQEAEVMTDLLAVERDESALVWTAQSQSLPVEHRSDVSPLALLGIVQIVRTNGSGR